MAQFDVYRFESRGAASIFVVDLQHDFLKDLTTRIVAPLHPLGSNDRPPRRLNPIFQIEGKPYYLAPQELAALRVKSLGAKVASLSEQRAEIVAALDFLVTGI
jgi:toxin CcdB